MPTYSEAKEITRPCGLKILYFCPSTVINNVYNEFKRWAPHRSVVMLGVKTKAQRRFLLDVMQEHPEYVVVCNYEAWRKDKSLIEDLINIEFDTCIIDEAHNIKDMKSIAYRGIKEILSVSNIPFVFPMTGTPILNKPEELFTLLTLVDPDNFYRLNYFLRDYCMQDSYTGKWVFQHGGLDRLSRRIGNLFMRRTKDQAGIKLPPKTIQVHEIEINEDQYPMQASARKQMREWASIVLDNEGKSVTAAAAIAVYTRLRQIETYPGGIKITRKHEQPNGKFAEEVILDLAKEGYDESQKIDYVIRPNGPENSLSSPDGLLVEVGKHPVTNPDGERVVVFSQFKEPLRVIHRRLQAAGYRSVVLDGDTPDSVRTEISEDFDLRNGTNKWDIVLCNYKVGGVGLNFTAATQMIILDEEWNPGKRDQAYDRIHRIGQDKPVTIHVLRAWFPVNGDDDNKGGIDIWLSNIIAHKEDIVEGFNTAMDNIGEQGKSALNDGLI